MEPEALCAAGSSRSRSRSRNGLRMLAVLALAVTQGVAAQSTHRITEVFSNQDGSIQFIRLTEMAGLDARNAFAGLAITVTSAAGTRRWVFPSALPSDATSYRHVIVGVAPTVPWPGLGDVPTIYGFSGCCIARAHPDFVLPANFLPTDGGTIDFAGIDRITYAALPIDGMSALYADQRVAPAELPTASCPGVRPPACPTQLRPTPTLVTAVEYHDAARDHYFITASSPDLDALDSGRLAGWQRTGESIPVGVRPATALGLEYTYTGSGVCRFYIPPGAGDSHFFAASPAECEEARVRFPSLMLETTTAFHAAFPDPATGRCGVMPGYLDGDIELRPVYRLWNARADGNHRYTMSADTRAAMVARGWVAEGYGPLGVVWCVL